jgi:hypothetical protein
LRSKLFSLELRLLVLAEQFDREGDLLDERETGLALINLRVLALLFRQMGQWQLQVDPLGGNDLF